MSARDVLQSILEQAGLDTRVTAARGGVTSGDFEQRQILRFMNMAGRDTVQRAEWPEVGMPWPEPISGVEPVLSLKISAEIRVLGTGVSIRLRDGSTPRAVLNPSVWQRLTSGEPINPYVFVHEGREIQCTHDLRGADITVYGWNWVYHQTDEHENATLQREITDLSDTFAFPEHLLELGGIWRWKRAKGLPYDGEFAEYEREVALNARNTKLAI